MLQYGLGLTVARQVAQTRIPENQARLPELFGTVQKAFALVSLLVAAVALALYVFYLHGADKRGECAAAWFLYAAGVAMNLQGQGRLCIMDGFGEVGWEKVFRIFFTAFGLAAIWIALRAGADIVTLSTIYAAQNALFWFVAARKVHIALPATRVTASPSAGQLSRLFHEGGKILFLNLSYYATTYSGVFVVQNRFGLSSVAPFSAMLKVNLLLSCVAVLPPQMLYPYVANAWASNDHVSCRRYYLLGLFGGLGIYILMVIPIFLLREPLFTHWLGKGKYLGTPTFVAFLIYQLIYVFHVGHASPALATKAHAFIVPAIISDVLTLVLLAFLPKWFGYEGIPLSMILGLIPASCIVVWQSWQSIMRTGPSMVDTVAQPVKGGVGNTADTFL
jgi:O-antigen/teichoic acid export membrane protein